MNTNSIPTHPLPEWLSGSHDEEMRRLCAEECEILTRYFRFLIPYHDGATIYRDRYETREEAEQEHARAGKWVLSGVEEYIDLRRVPNYPSSLDACVELRAALKDEERDSFIGNIAKVFRTPARHGLAWDFLNLTPRQITLAFLLTRGRVAIS